MKEKSMNESAQSVDDPYIGKFDEYLSWLKTFGEDTKCRLCLKTFKEHVGISIACLESLGDKMSTVVNIGLPEEALARKTYPVARGVLDYFPLAIIAIARISYLGNKKHNPGQPLHWERSKSGDEADALIRHFLARGALDTDGELHSARMAWRALALLQKELEQNAGKQ